MVAVGQAANIAINRSSLVAEMNTARHPQNRGINRYLKQISLILIGEQNVKCLIGTRWLEEKVLSRNPRQRRVFQVNFFKTRKQNGIQVNSFC